MKTKFIRKNPQIRFIRPSNYQRPLYVVDAKSGEVSKNNIKEEKEIEDTMTKAEEIAAMVSNEPTAPKTEKTKAVKNNNKTIKKNDGLIERVDVTYMTDDNKTLLND